MIPQICRTITRIEAEKEAGPAIQRRCNINTTHFGVRSEFIGAADDGPARHSAVGEEHRHGFVDIAAAE